MRKRSFSSLFEEFPDPRSLLDLDLRRAASLHAGLLGVPMGDGDFALALERASGVYGFCGNRDWPGLLSDLRLGLEISPEGLGLEGFMAFSVLIPDERKIILYSPSLQELFLFSHKFLKEGWDYRRFEDMAVFHEICHYVDSEVIGGFGERERSCSEITAGVFLTRRLGTGWYARIPELLYVGRLIGAI